MVKENKGAVSLRADSFVDALPIPIDGNFEWIECRFNLFDYTKKSGEVVATATAARINFRGEDGQEYVQQYSVTDPQRFVPSPDGKRLIPVAEGAVALNKQSNFYILTKALEDAGLPEGFMDDDISVLDGLVTHNIGVPEPVRVGLTSGEKDRRPRVIPIPDEIILLPGAKKGAKVGAGRAGTTDKSDKELLADALANLAEEVAGGGKVTRQSLASTAIRAKNTKMAQFVFKGLSDDVLAANGYEVDDNGVITAAE